MFIVGEEYPRDRLLNFVGSKQSQSGIIWGTKRTDCVLVTSGGRHSEEAGYYDERKADGSWIYFGQGGSGDQNPKRFSNKIIIEQKRSILLFSTRQPTPEEIKARGTHSKRYMYEGSFNIFTWDIFTPSVGRRAGNQLLRFYLIPTLDSYTIDTIEKESPPDVENDLHKIKEAALRYEPQPKQSTQALHEYRLASYLIKKYARLRANGICECCDKPAPFVDVNGYPFLEVHHIFRLADDGPDSPVNVAAICPNCHREAHFGSNIEEIRGKLAARILYKEQALDSGQK
jgi:5-methylcytosine-specific restriction protein A